MNTKKALTISVLPAMWLIYIIFELLTGRITDLKTIIFNIFLILLFALVGYIIYSISLKHNNGFDFNNLLILTSFPFSFLRMQKYQLWKIAPMVIQGQKGTWFMSAQSLKMKIQPSPRKFYLKVKVFFFKNIILFDDISFHIFIILSSLF